MFEPPIFALSCRAHGDESIGTLREGFGQGEAISEIAAQELELRAEEERRRQELAKSNKMSRRVLKKAEISSGHDQQDPRIFQTDLTKFLDSLPEYWLPDKEEYCCPLFPFCIRRFSNKYALKWHIAERHQETLLEERLTGMQAYLEEFTKERGAPLETGALGHCMCEYKGCQRSIGNEAEFMAHILEHTQNIGDDPEFNARCLCVIVRTKELWEATKEVPMWKTVIAPPVTDSTLILVKDLHYDKVEVPDKIQEAPWVAITSDPRAIPHLPLVFHDGGILVAKGQARIANNHIQLRPEYDQEEHPPVGGQLIPQIVGTPPNFPPVFLSQIDQFEPLLQSFLIMLMQSLAPHIHLNLPGSFQTDHLQLPWEPTHPSGPMSQLPEIEIEKR